jgi:hypothetical protein
VAELEPIQGHVVQHDRPCWDPLVDVLGRDLAGRFMWICEIELADKTRLHAYKHITTRGYLHLDAAGRAFHYDESGRYQAIAAPIAIARVFAGWHRSSPTDRDAAALRAAMHRARCAA